MESVCDESEIIAYRISPEKPPSSEPTPKRSNETHERSDAPNRTAERCRRAVGEASSELPYDAGEPSDKPQGTNRIDPPSE